MIALSANLRSPLPVIGWRRWSSLTPTSRHRRRTPAIAGYGAGTARRPGRPSESPRTPDGNPVHQVQNHFADPLKVEMATATDFRRYAPPTEASWNAECERRTAPSTSSLDTASDTRSNRPLCLLCQAPELWHQSISELPCDDPKPHSTRPVSGVILVGGAGGHRLACSRGVVTRTKNASKSPARRDVELVCQPRLVSALASVGGVSYGPRSEAGLNAPSPPAVAWRAITVQ
jgi:hypothetical protein